MADYPIASDLSQLVLEKRRRESEGALLPAQQTGQSFYAHVPGSIKAAILAEHIGGEREPLITELGDGGTVRHGS